MRIPTRKSETDRLALQGEPDRFLTPEAMERMRRQIHDLETVQRPAAKLELQKAQEMGDLSENFGYQEAKRRLRSINDRIVMLEEKLKVAVPIRAGSEDGKIRIGSTVTVETGGKETEYMIVGAQEAQPLRRRISYLSPLGALLIGKSAGDAVTLTTERGSAVYRILSVA